MKTEILKTEEAIALVKETFAKELSQKLHLTKVSSPLAVIDGTGINDDLNGIERAVKFPIKAQQEKQAVVVHSLAKWKRLRLMQLGVETESGILTDMRALRPDEDYTHLHSVYVDQWDWEAVMPAESRSIAYLKSKVTSIYKALKTTEKGVEKSFPEIKAVLPDVIKFIHAEELLQKYPELSVKERETEAAKEFGAVFIIGIGGALSSGEPHDGRAPDYDDWSTESELGLAGLNGDIVLWHPVLKQAFEVSSMGIRVDKAALGRQLTIRDAESRKALPFHKLLLEDKLPQTIGGGIGQSRVCMFMLKKQHIGEVQVGIWADEVVAELAEKGVTLL